MKKTHSRNSGTGREWKIHSHNSGMGIRGFHSWEWTGTGIPAHPCYGKYVNEGSLNIVWHNVELYNKIYDSTSWALYTVRASYTLQNYIVAVVALGAIVVSSVTRNPGRCLPSPVHARYRRGPSIILKPLLTLSIIFAIMSEHHRNIVVFVVMFCVFYNVLRKAKHPANDVYCPSPARVQSKVQQNKNKNQHFILWPQNER